jgi:hypothetical protein
MSMPPRLLKLSPAAIARTALGVVLFLCTAVQLRAQSPVPSTAGSNPQTYAIILSGIGGDSDYEKMIDGWAKDLHTSLASSGMTKDHLFWLAGKKQEGTYGESTKAEITKLLTSLVSRVQPQDVVELYLIGHGSYDNYDYRFNIPGPDLTGGELATLLNQFKAERQLVVNMTSSSGGSITDLRRKGRVLISSTTAGQERNFSVFARYFVAGVQDSAADADKNEAISALEAFRYATREVTRYYDSAKRLATEHPVLEDKGDTDGVREPNAENGQGLLAAALTVRKLGKTSQTLETPEIKIARAKKRSVEEAIEQLKYSKASMETAVYTQKLEALLLDLARTQAALDKLEEPAGVDHK